MKRLLKEPLLHFFALGALLFLAYRVVPGSGLDAGPSSIVVTRGRIENLAAGFASVWQRSPTPDELKGLIDDWVREEIAVREATTLGLDINDTVVRRRLRQKFEFLIDDAALQAEPTDAELSAYMAAHPEAFAREPRFTFSHVYLNPARHPDDLAAVAAGLLAQLNSAAAPADPAALGDPFMLDRDFIDLPAGEVAKIFGDRFAASLDALAVGAAWQGPVPSGLGAHLVLLRARAPGRVPPLDEARDVARREWANARRTQAIDDLYARLLERYGVTIESPAASAPADAGAP